MSDQDSNAEAISEAQQLFTDSAIIYGLAALMAYEYVLTFYQEVTTIWPRKKRSGPAWLFIVNRYLLILATVLSCAPIPNARVCSGTIRLGQAVGIAQYLVFAAFNALRVYAFWDRNVICSLLVLALGLIPVATNLYVLSLSTPLFFKDPIMGNFCTATITISSTLYFRIISVLMTTRASVIASDAIVLLVTWTKTWHTYRAASRVDVQVPLSYLILRDGTIYFVALLAMNILETLAAGVSVFEELAPVNSFIVTLTPILISRFILNLRDASQSYKESSGDTYDSRFSAPGFRVPTVASFAGNMGEMLEYDPSSEVQEAERDMLASVDPLEEPMVVPASERGDTSTNLIDPHIIREEPRLVV